MKRMQPLRRTRGHAGKHPRRWSSVAAAAGAALVAASCAVTTVYTRAQTSAMQSAALANLAQGDPRADRTPPLATYTAVEPGDSTVLPRPYRGAPPQVPHDLEGLLPITLEENSCYACHHPDMAGDDDIPIPASHFAWPQIMVVSRADAGADSRATLSYVAGYEQNEDVLGARYNCVQCHTPRAENLAAVTVQRSLHDLLSASRMRRLHPAAAQHIEDQQIGREAVAAVELSLRYAMAGEPAQALINLQSAATSVQRPPAPREVILIRERILDLVQQSPGLPGHRRELVVALMNLAEARQLAFAVVDAETTRLCERVLELSVTLEDAREFFLASMGMFSNRFYTGRYQEALEIGRRLLAATKMFPHPFMIQSAHFAIAGVAYRLANLDKARSHFESCLEHAAHSQQTYGWDFHSMSLSHLALVAFHCGRRDGARRLVHQAEAYGSRDGASPDAAVIPLLEYALAPVGDDDAAMVRVERALAKSERIGAAAWIERAHFVQGLLSSRQGHVAEGVRLMQDSLARHARNNLFIDRSAYCALLADEMLRRGLPGAQTVKAGALAYVERSGERHFEVELRGLEAALR